MCETGAISNPVSWGGKSFLEWRSPRVGRSGRAFSEPRAIRMGAPTIREPD
jgi:hypothetical protein